MPSCHSQADERSTRTSQDHQHESHLVVSWHPGRNRPGTWYGEHPGGYKFGNTKINVFRIGNELLDQHTQCEQLLRLAWLTIPMLIQNSVVVSVAIVGVAIVGVAVVGVAVVIVGSVCCCGRCHNCAAVLSVAADVSVDVAVDVVCPVDVVVVGFVICLLMNSFGFFPVFVLLVFCPS